MTRNNYRDYKSLTQHPSDYKSDGTGDAHHIIPVELLYKNEFVKKAVIGGFDFNGVINGVKAKHHHGPHKEYTEMVRNTINDIAASNKNCTPEEAKVLQEEIASKFRNTINENY